MAGSGRGDVFVKGLLPAQEALWEMIEAGAVEILPLGIDDVPRMKELMRKYRDLPMDSLTPRSCASPSVSGCAGFHPRPARLSDLSPFSHRPLFDFPIS